jgi:hypothetical protein
MMPFRFNPRLASRAARLHALKRKGIIQPPRKATLRIDAEQAATTATITVIPTGKRTRAPERD